MLANDLMFFHKGFLGEDAIGLQRHCNGFLEVNPGFFEGFPLGIGSRKFLDESDVTLGDFSENRGQFHNAKCPELVGEFFPGEMQDFPVRLDDPMKEIPYPVIAPTSRTEGRGS